MTSPSDADIRAALTRIAASEPFRKAPQLASFLRFVVEKALAGQQHAIKGYTIATEALGRPADFDPQADPIVRVEAGRLRRALESYYAGPGLDDAVRIAIPRGTYVPRFTQAETGALSPGGAEPAPEAARAEPEDPRSEEAGPPPHAFDVRRIWILAASLLVLAVALAGLASLILPRDGTPWRASEEGRRISPDLQDGRPVVGVTQIELNGTPFEGFSPEIVRSMVLDGLARFEEIVVIDLANGQEMPGVDRYILNLRATTNVSGGAVVSRLTHAPSGHIVWSRIFPIGRQKDPSMTTESSIARQVAVAVAKPYGILFADLRTRSGLNERTRCVVQAYEYWDDPGAAAHGRVRDCLEKAAEAQPSAVVLAALTSFYLDEHRVGFNPRPDPIDRALRTAWRAVELAPESPRANQALMAALWAVNDAEQALQRGRRALDLNPYDSDIAADLGSRLVQAGRYGEGADLLRRAAAANPAGPVWYDFFLFLAAYMQHDLDAARAATARIGASDYVLGLIARIAVAVHDGQAALARELSGRLTAVQPEFGTDPAGALAKRNFAPEIRSRLLAALRGAGLKG